MRGQTPDPACGAHGPDPRCSREKVGQGRGGRLRLIDAGALTPPPLPTHGPPRGQREGNLNAG